MDCTCIYWYTHVCVTQPLCSLRQSSSHKPTLPTPHTSAKANPEAQAPFHRSDVTNREGIQGVFCITNSLSSTGDPYVSFHLLKAVIVTADPKKSWSLFYLILISIGITLTFQFLNFQKAPGFSVRNLCITTEVWHRLRSTITVKKFGYLRALLTTCYAHQAVVATNNQCLSNYAINVWMYRCLHVQLGQCFYYKYM